jgi:subtilisin family serine protease
MKPGILRSSLIALSISLYLTPLAAVSAPSHISAVQSAGEAQDKPGNYLIVFDEPGLMYYEGGVDGIRATSIRATGERKLDVTSEASLAYRAHVEQFHETKKAEIEALIGRTLGQVYRYDIAFNGLGLSLSKAEALKLKSIEGIKSIRAVRDRELDTNRGPTFIGAGSIWDGSAAPGGVASRGDGVVIGVIDTGANRNHPSFGVLPAECGASAGQTKLTAYNCLSGTCTTTDEPGADCTVNGGEGTAEDCNGHGSHTASTAGGNTLLTSAPPPAPVRNISGVATCAKINAYKVCATNSCSGLAIPAAIEQAIADGVDVINFSISGGGGDDASIWAPGETSDRLFLDALNADILVAASAGNTRAENPTPVGDVNHRGPWLTSVAASSHDEVTALPGSIQVTGPGAVPVDLASPITLTASSSPLQIPANSNLLVRDFPTAPTGCNADAVYPANYFDGGTALISRGACSFAEKVTKAVAAGATSVIVYNNAAGVISMAGLEAATVPAYSILQTEGQALVAFSSTLGGAPIEATGQPPQFQGDVLANFSLRGPISPVAPGSLGPSNSFDVTKPDITAPGVDIYAAVSTPANYGILSGTSMSSPHIAGAYALLRSVRPTWTASEIKSALMMTAFNGGTKEDGSTAWDPDDVGSGRADLTKAALAGLVMDETFANFLAADPGNGGDPRTLNVPSLRHTDCTPNCSWTRTVKSTLAVGATWNVDVQQPEGFEVEVSPTQFTLAGGATQTLTITATVQGGEMGQTVRFGRIRLSPAVPSQSPALEISVALKRETLDDTIFEDDFELEPTCLSVNGFTTNGDSFSGDPSNTVVTLPIGATNQLIGLAADVTVDSFDPSWLSESGLLMSSTVNDNQGIALTPGSGTDTPGSVEYTTGGVVIFADLGLPNVVPVADGLLRLEWNESFNDGDVDPDSEWNDAANPVTCPGIHLVCSDQAACDAAVSNFQP